MEHLVSVIVPVYNVEQYLDKCIDSIVNQTYKNLEIILVDDGSPDLCPQKCDEWKKKDSRIQVIHKENAGVGFARNSGLDIAKGDYIMFVDSDDYISLDIIEIMVKRIEKDHSDIAVIQCIKVYADGRQDIPSYFWVTDKLITKEDAWEMMNSSQALPVYAWGKLYRKHIFDKIRYQSLKCAEDVYILPDIIEQCKNISLVDIAGYFYFQRDTSIVHTKKLVQMIDNIKASLRISRFLFERNYMKGAGRYYYAAVCQYFETNNNIEAKKLLKEAYTPTEKKLIRKARNMEMSLAILIARFPNVYKFYKLYIVKKN